MIRSWGTAATRRFAESGKSSFRALDEVKALARLQLLDATGDLGEVPQLRSIALHKLSGSRAGHWAITINGPWRLVFTFREGGAYDVEVVDYH